MGAGKTSEASTAKTPVVSAAKKAPKTDAKPKIFMKSTTSWGADGTLQSVVDGIEMSYAAPDVAALLTADTTDVFAASATDVPSAAKTASGASKSPRYCRIRVMEKGVRVIRICSIWH